MEVGQLEGDFWPICFLPNPKTVMNTDGRIPAKVWKRKFIKKKKVMLYPRVGPHKRRFGGFMALAVGMIALGSQARAASLASDTGLSYTNPWNAANVQNNPVTGFGNWQFDNYPSNGGYSSIQNGRWTLSQLADDSQGNAPYDAVFRGFGGDGTLDVGQSLNVQLFFTPPGPYTVTGQTPSQGFDLFAQDPLGSPSRYLSYGHEALGLYLGPSGFGLAYNDTHVSEETYTAYESNAIPFTGTATNPQEVDLSLTALGNNHFELALATDGKTYTFDSTLFSTAIDGLRFFTSQGGTQPGGPLAIGQMSVTQAVPEPGQFGLFGVGLVSLLGFFRFKRTCV
jgi:hypothetical protein